MENNEKVKAFYAEYNEKERTDQESLEFLRSKSIISRFLTGSPMEIADVGGAAGAYSFWLAGLEHRVHLLDLMEKHIRIAEEKSRETGVRLASYSCADARELPYADKSMDMVLLMGALYHLHSDEARIKCLREAFRVLKDGGVILCTVMNRYSGIIATVKYKLTDEVWMENIAKSLEDGIHEKANFYSHTPRGLTDEMTAVGFGDIALIPVEGIANALSDNKLPADEKEAAHMLWGIEQTESIPELLGVTRNIIGVGKKA